MLLKGYTGELVTFVCRCLTHHPTARLLRYDRPRFRTGAALSQRAHAAPPHGRVKDCDACALDGSATRRLLPGEPSEARAVGENRKAEPSTPADPCCHAGALDVEASRHHMRNARHGDHRLHQEDRYAGDRQRLPWSRVDGQAARGVRFGRAALTPGSERPRRCAKDSGSCALS